MDPKCDHKGRFESGEEDLSKEGQEEVRDVSMEAGGLRARRGKVHKPRNTDSLQMLETSGKQIRP